MGDIEKEYVGHDNKVYEVSKTYTGSNFVHINAAPFGTPYGSDRVQHLTLHVDDIEAVFKAIKEVMNG
jgi:hypothetical protein